jgi:hypothetical protein
VKRFPILALFFLVFAAIISAQTPPGGYSSPTLGGSSSSTSISNGAINPQSAPYNADFKVQFVGDASWTNATQTVNFPQADVNLSAVAVGYIMFGTNCIAQINPNLVSSCSVSVPQGTIASIGVNSVGISTTTTTTCTPSSTVTCNFAVGKQDDTSAINTAATAAYNTAGGNCALSFPAGAAFISAAIVIGPGNNRCWQGATGTTSIADLTSVGPIAYGQGSGATVFIILPSFNAASCTGGGGGNKCFFTLGNMFITGFSITGLGNPGTGSQSIGLVSIEGTNGGGACDGGTTIRDVALSVFWWNVTNTIGLSLGQASCNNSVALNVNISAFGATELAVLVSGNTYTATGLFAWGGSSNTISYNAANSSTFNCFGCQFGGPLSGNVAILVCGAVGTAHWNDYGGKWAYFNGTPTIESVLICSSGSAVFLFDGDNLSINPGTTSTSQIFFLTAGSTVRLRDTTVTATGTNNRLANTGASDFIYDESGNTITNGTVASTFAGPVYGITNSALGTKCATGNFALTSGWGTSTIASVTANGSILGCQITITGAAGLANPVLTWTYPVAPGWGIGPASCHISGGGQGTLTGAQAGTPGATSVAYTFTGTPSVQTYIFDVGCP